MALQAIVGGELPPKRVLASTFVPSAWADDALLEERKAELYKKKVDRGEVARLERKKVMKTRKAERIERKLQDLVLDPAPNQVIPGIQPSA